MSSSKLPGGDKPEDRSVTTTDSPATASAFSASSQPHGHILQHPNMHPHPSKSARPIAPAPIMSGSSGTTTLTTPGNIPNFISPALVSKTSDSRHVTPIAPGLTSSASHGPLSHPGTLNQPLVQFPGASSAALTTAAMASTNQLPSGTLRAQVQPPLASFSTHIPKGAVVANQLVMRSPQPTAIPISSGSGHLVVGRQPTVIPAIKTGSPANTRASSPAITIPTTQVPVSAEQLRSSAMALPVAGQPGAPIHITLRQAAATEGKPSLPHVPQKIIVTQPKVVNPLSINPKTVAFPVSAQTGSGVVVATTGTAASVASAGSTPIPVAKVPPQRQQQQQLPVSTMAVSMAPSLPVSLPTPLNASEAVSLPAYQTMSSILMGSSRPLNASTAATTTITIPTPATQADIRQDSQQRPNNIPQLSAFNPQDHHVWYQTPYPVYSPIAPAQVQVTTQPTPSPLVQPPAAATTMTQNLSTILIPKRSIESTAPNQGPMLSATLPAGLQQPHAMNLAPTQQMRLVAVETRQPLAVQISTPTPASIAPSSGVGDPKPIISITPSSRMGAALLPSQGGEMASMTSLPSTATVASSIYTSSTAQAQPPASSAAPPTNPTSSPRPSILRKRFIDGTPAIPKRPNFTMVNESHSPRPENSSISNASSPKTPAGDNSQSSTDTALSTEGQTNSHPDPRNRHEAHDGLENGPSVSTSSNCNAAAAAAAASVHNSNAVEESPRKRPRKQLLHINAELKDHHTSSDDDMDVKMADGKDDQAHSSKPDVKDEYIDEEGVRYVNRSPNPKVGLLNFYNQTWKARNNHFTRYSEVKKKEERRPTVNELANKRGIMQKSSGWKIYCMSAQLEHYMDYEKSYCDKLCSLQTLLTPKQSSKHSMDDDSSSLYECTQACIQRSKLLLDQTEETISNMMQIFSHKPSITEIIQKHMSKRPIKKKERT